MAGVDLTTFNYALKELYPNGITPEVYKNNPFLALVPKDTGFYGKQLLVDVIYGDTQGRAAQIAKAQANYTAHEGLAFAIKRAKDYAYAVVDRETMKAAAKDSGAVVKAMETEMRSATNVIKNSLAHAAWGTGTGRIGQIATGGISSSTITLADPDEIVNINRGQTIVLSTADGGGSVKSGTLKVATVNRNAGTFTTTVAVTTGIATAAALDFIFTDGDYDLKMKGVDAWIPAADPTPGENFFGVDRSFDSVRLAGVRFDGSGYNPEEALIKGASRLAREEGSPDYAFLNFDDFANLETSLGSKKVYEDITGPFGIGFRGLVIKGPNGDIRAVQDRNRRKGAAKLITMSSWTLHSLGEAPEMVEDDGLRFRRIAGTDTYGTELAYYAQLACESPAYNAHVLMPS